MKLTQCFITKLFHFCLSQDHKAAFKSKTTMEVFRALVVFQLCGIKKLVDNNEMASCAKEKTKNIYFPPADETGTKDTWEKSLWRGHEENLLRPFRSRTGIFLHANGNCQKWVILYFLTLKPGHSGDRSNDRPDAELWREEHSGLQRGGGHQPRGSGTARE